MKALLQKVGLPFLRKIDPETSHGLAVNALRYGLTPTPGPVRSSRLFTELSGLSLPNPIGLAAGFDKNATAVAPLLQSGFGFIEVGAVTPRPQSGNPKPRLFRLSEDEAAINRFGFNNDGADTISDRLTMPREGILGINLGANKDSENKAEDFAHVLRKTAAYVDFATVNVSSPNTEKLRDLQGKDALLSVLHSVMDANDLARPIFLKIAPDLTETEISDIVDAAHATGINGIVATNTTLSRDGLSSEFASENGGLSGQPLFEKSTRVLAQIAHQTELPLIGVGGISNADQAYAKIKAGATAVQLYTAMVYQGLDLATKIATDLDLMLQQDGFDSINQAVGTEKEKWL